MRKLLADTECLKLETELESEGSGERFFLRFPRSRVTRRKKAFKHFWVEILKGSWIWHFAKLLAQRLSMKIWGYGQTIITNSLSAYKYFELRLLFVLDTKILLLNIERDQKDLALLKYSRQGGEVLWLSRSRAEMQAQHLVAGIYQSKSIKKCLFCNSNGI